MPNNTTGATGGCPCGQVRYRVLANPMVVHCCHCRWCQRETGTAFAVNMIYEVRDIVLLPPSQGDAWAFRYSSTKPEPDQQNAEADRMTTILTPSESGKGQTISRCKKCQVAIWSDYGGPGPAMKFLRGGTLDDSSVVEPDVYIFTSSKQPWVTFPAGAKVFDAYYNRREVWTAENNARMDRLKESTQASAS